jgi:hypothetical protein
MQPPSIDNLFIPGGVVFYFDPGTGERDLGLIEEPPDVEVKSNEVKVYSNRSGVRRLADVFPIEEEINWSFKLQELVAANLQAFFKGGDLEVMGGGTDSETDQKLTLAGTVPVSTGNYGISAVTVRQFLDKCFVYDGADYTDNTTEADSLAGTPFTTLTDDDDILYLGKGTPFKEVYFNFAVSGEYGAVVVEYWNGSAWTEVSGLGGAAAELAADGKMNWTLPDDWALTTVNSYSAYWIKITATTPWTTPATVNCIRQNAVQNTDYIVDPGQVATQMLNGKIGRLADGFLADGEEVKVSYTYTTWSSLRFAVANADFQQGAARLSFLPSRGFQWSYVIPKCQLKPNGKLVFDDKKPIELPMILEVLDGYETSPDAPYGYWECLNET